MSRLPTEASFLKDVAEHEMDVRHDDGLFRSIRFSQPESWNMGFDITTWPGYLCISGDMGCHVFSRIADMFEFFRREPYEGKGTLFVNPDYWGEKVEAVDRHGAIEEYSPEKFRAVITQWLDDDEASPEMRKAVKDEVLTYAEDGEHKAVEAAIEFDFKGRRPFNDFWEVNVKDYTYRFIWCCYAIAWAVKQYDAYVAQKTESVAKGA